MTSKVIQLAATCCLLISSTFLCTSCATTDLVGYPDNLWPALRFDPTCEGISGSYESLTEEVWPMAAARGSSAKLRESLAYVLAEVSPSSRPENLPTVNRVEISVSSKKAKLYGAWNDVVDMSRWECSGEGAWVTSINRKADGELSLDARVEFRYELRQAADHSLVVHELAQFSDLSIKGLLRETWYRFLPASPH